MSKLDRLCHILEYSLDLLQYDLVRSRFSSEHEEFKQAVKYFFIKQVLCMPTLSDPVAGQEGQDANKQNSSRHFTFARNLCNLLFLLLHSLLSGPPNLGFFNSAIKEELFRFFNNLLHLKHGHLFEAFIAIKKVAELDPDIG